MQAASYLYSLAHPELIALIQLLFFGHYHMVTIGNPHLYWPSMWYIWHYPKLLNQYLSMVCPGWLRLAKPLGNKYCFTDYCKVLLLFQFQNLVYPKWLGLAHCMGKVKLFCYFTIIPSC